MELKEDDVIFCRVKKIEGTTVFLEIEEYNLEGSMVLSEVAAGRIRNLKKYVSPNRKVVCKVLKISPDHVELSLRRVTAKEKEEVLERYKKEKALMSTLKLVGEYPEKILFKIKEEYDIISFFDEMKENPLVLQKFIAKNNIEKIVQILSERYEKGKKVEKRFSLKSFSERGVNDIKEILEIENVEIHYLGNSIFSIFISGKDFKEANNKLDCVLEEIERRAKQKKAVFEMKKEK